MRVQIIAYEVWRYSKKGGTLRYEETGERGQVANFDNDDVAPIVLSREEMMIYKQQLIRFFSESLAISQDLLEVSLTIRVLNERISKL